MNTKLIVSVNAIFLGIIGILLTFLPDEIARLFIMSVEHVIIFKLMGAAYFAMAMMNWTARASILGGIYGRAIVIGNFTHFAIAGLSIAKYQMANLELTILWPITVGFVLSAMVFGYFFFSSPIK